MGLGFDNLFNRYTSLGTLTVALAVGFIAVQGGGPGATAADQTMIKGADAVVYKSPSCGCCGAWAQYAERRGMNVEVNEVRNLDQVKEKHNIPQGKEACHTTVIGDYAVEGHVPTEPINQLLKEKPDVQGIGLPGMPQGSPGMPGPKQGDWNIYQFNSETSSEYMTV